MGTISLTAEELNGRRLLDETGRDIGPIADLYVDGDGRPHWLLVDTGFFPNFRSVIPVTDVLVTGRGLEVHYGMEKLTGAPNCMKDKDYAAHREGLLYDYYKLEAPESVKDATITARARISSCRPAPSVASRRSRARTSRWSSSPSDVGRDPGLRLSSWPARAQPVGLPDRTFSQRSWSTAVRSGGRCVARRGP